MQIDKLIRTKRKTVALHVNEEAEVIVRAPRWVSRSFIETFVTRHMRWIEEQKQMLFLRGLHKKQYTDGEQYLYVGETIALRYTDRIKKTYLHKGFLHMPRTAQDPRSMIEKWYKKEARSYLLRRVQELAGTHGFVVNNIRITSAKTRWGSCSGKGNLNFTWRLIMAPPQVIDYVIYHELAHLRHMNHSRDFWNLVARMCPEHKAHQIWLHEHGARMIV